MNDEVDELIAALEANDGQTEYRGWKITRLQRSFYAWKGSTGEDGILRAFTSSGILRQIRKRETKDR